MLQLSLIGFGFRFQFWNGANMHTHTKLQNKRRKRNSNNNNMNVNIRKIQFPTTQECLDVCLYWIHFIGFNKYGEMYGIRGNNNNSNKRTAMANEIMLNGYQKHFRWLLAGSASIEYPNNRPIRLYATNTQRRYIYGKINTTSIRQKSCFCTISIRVCVPVV